MLLCASAAASGFDTRNEKQIVQFINDHVDEEFITCAACAFELFAGVYRAKDKGLQEKALQQLTTTLSGFSDVYQLDTDQAQIAGKIQADLSNRGNIIDDVDIQIAAATISAGATLVTGNARHFSRVKNLRVLPIPS